MSSTQTVKRTVTASWEPVEIRDVKKHLEIPDAATAHDSLLATLTEAAREIVEDDTGLVIPTTTCVLNWDTWPDAFVLPVRPAISVTSIKYYDNDGNQQTWSSANYTLDTARSSPTIFYAYNVTTPAIRDIENAIEVTWSAGYSSQSAVPEKIKQAVQIKLAQLFIDREGMENVRANPRGNPWEFESAYQALVRRLQRSSYP